MDQIWSYRVPVWAVGASLLLVGAVMASIAIVGSNVRIEPHHLAWGVVAIGAMAAASWGASQLTDVSRKQGKQAKSGRRDDLIDIELAKVLAVIKSRLAHDESYANRLNDVQVQLEQRPSADELAARS